MIEEAADQGRDATIDCAFEAVKTALALATSVKAECRVGRAPIAGTEWTVDAAHAHAGRLRGEDPPRIADPSRGDDPCPSTPFPSK